MPFPPSIFGFAYNPYLWPFLVSLLITAGLGIHAWRKRHLQAAPLFAGVMLGLSIWTLCYLLELANPTLAGKLFWAKAKYLGSTTAPVLWFMLGLKLSRNERWLGTPLILLLSSFVIVTCFVVFTNDAHRWFWTDVWLVPGEPETASSHGFYFWIYAATLYSLVLGNVILLFRYFRTTPALYRQQARLLALGGFLPLGGRILEDFFAIDLFPHIDNVIVLFLASGVLFGLAIFRYGALTLSHIGHNLVIRNIGAGIIVLDVGHRVVELNPFAQALLPAMAGNPLGQPVQAVLAGWPPLDLDRHQGQEVELGERCYQLEITPILADNRQIAGHALVIFDISARKQAERQLALLARTDPLTGLANRRYFNELAEREFERASRQDFPLSLMILDIDHFKAINDRYGHPVGDGVIIEIAAICREQLRDIDPTARYGGEEFIVLLLDCPLPQAREKAETLRARVAQARIELDGHIVTTTISLGLAQTGSDCLSFSELLKRADEALYAAKAAGRNQVMAWPVPEAAQDQPAFGAGQKKTRRTGRVSLQGSNRIRQPARFSSCWCYPSGPPYRPR